MAIEKYQIKGVAARRIELDSCGPALRHTLNPNEPAAYLELCNAALSAFLTGGIDSVNMGRVVGAATRTSVERDRTEQYHEKYMKRVDQQPEQK